MPDVAAIREPERSFAERAFDHRQVDAAVEHVLLEVVVEPIRHREAPRVLSNRDDVQQVRPHHWTLSIV